ncbi:MAG: hypothetical protein GC191_09430 [Azospirillum sp.]|nr:hypothetical protein [Azospirillum sp.]
MAETSGLDALWRDFQVTAAAYAAEENEELDQRLATLEAELGTAPVTSLHDAVIKARYIRYCTQAFGDVPATAADTLADGLKALAVQLGVLVAVPLAA